MREIKLKEKPNLTELFEWKIFVAICFVFIFTFYWENAIFSNSFSLSPVFPLFQWHEVFKVCFFARASARYAQLHDVKHCMQMGKRVKNKIILMCVTGVEPMKCYFNWIIGARFIFFPICASACVLFSITSNKTLYLIG